MGDTYFDPKKWRVSNSKSDPDISVIASQLADIATNVKSKGVKGDGTDESTVIQNIINGLTTFKTLLFPDGTYSFKNVSIPSDVKLIFNNNAKITAPPTATTADAFFRVNGTSGSLLSNISINGGIFDGSVGGTPKINLVVDANYVDTLFVQNVSGKNLNGETVVATNCNNVTVKDCITNNAQYGVVFSHTTRGLIQGCYAQTVKRDGILVYNGSQYVRVIGNMVENYTTGGETGRAGIHVYGSSDVTVNGNIVLTGNYDTEGIRFRDSNRFACTGNYIYGSGGSGIAVVCIGDFSPLNGGDGTISGNTIINPNLRGISVPYAQNAPVTIVGNIIKNQTSSSGTDGGAGIQVVNNGSTIIGNSIETCQGDGINISGNNCIISNNKVRNTGTGALGGRAGIYFTGGSGNVCTGNVIFDDQGTPTMVNAIRLFSTATALIQNNLASNGTNGTYRLDGKVLGAISGRVVMPNGANSVTVNHGMSVAPTNIITTPQWNSGNIWISNITSTQFTINCTTAPGSGTYVSWRAEL